MVQSTVQSSPEFSYCRDSEESEGVRMGGREGEGRERGGSEGGRRKGGGREGEGRAKM